jgi:hypothetical protein
MRVLIIAASIVFGLAAAAGTGLATSPRTPALVVSGHSVHGTRFYARETVRLTFGFGGVRNTARARTDAAGSFTDTVPVAYDPCVGPLTVIAVGLRGDRAKAVVAQRACPPPE